MKNDRPFSIQFIALRVAGLINLICYFQIAGAGDLRQKMPFFFTVHAVLAASFLFIVILTHKKGSLKLSSSTASLNQIFTNSWILIIAFATVYRVALLFDYLYLTDDIFRYIWDGRVWGHGINPYLYPPAHPALSPVRDVFVFPQVNHPFIPTIYAPLLQILFRVTATISSSLLAFKLLVVFFDLANIGLILILLKRWNLPLHRVVIYAWNPLVIIETAGSGHIDGIGVFFLLLALYFFEKRKAMLTGFTFGLAILVKFVPLFLIPFALHQGKWRRQIAITLALALTLVIGYSPFLDAGTALFKAMFIYADKWRFNDSIFYLVYEFIDVALPDTAVKLYIHAKDMLPDAETMRSLRVDLVLLLSKGFVGMIFLYLLVSLFLSLRTAGTICARKLLRIWLIIFGALCLLTPTLHPWYLLWILPVTVFMRGKAWLVLSITILWSYEIIFRYAADGIWRENGWVKLAIFLPFYFILFYETGQQRHILYSILRCCLPQNWMRRSENKV